MNAKRQLLAAFIVTTTAVPSQAGCLDWLFGKPAAPVYPYAAGYAPQATVTPVGPPVLTGSTVAPYAAAYAPYGAPYTANYAGTLPAIAAQAPAYGAAVPSYGVAIPNSATTSAYSLPYDNPSVLTGQPVMQTSAIQSIPTYGTAPALPPAAYAPSQAPGSGSFFSRMFGNDYQTSYYAVPTTTYRPVTQIDPATGQWVTVQQPCTSMTQQVQRSPYTSLQPAAPVQAPAYAEPVCGSEPPRYAAPTPYAAPIPSSSPYGQGTVGQSSYQALPAYPAPVSPAAPTVQPLTGYPNGYPYSQGAAGTATGDAAPVSQPQLDAMRPAWSSPSIPSTTLTPSYPPTSLPSTTLPSTSFPSTSLPSTSLPSTGSTLQAPPLLPPSASRWPSGQTQAAADGNVTAKPLPAADSNPDRYSDIAPIPAPDEYRAPAWTELYPQRPNATTVDSGTHGGSWQETTPSTRVPSNATLGEPRTASSDAYRDDHSVQYASALTLPALPAPQKPAPQKPAPRSDSGWFPIHQP